MCNILPCAGAGINNYNCNGCILLHIAALNGLESFYHAILSYGTNELLSTTQGNIPLQIFCKDYTCFINISHGWWMQHQIWTPFKLSRLMVSLSADCNEWPWLCAVSIADFHVYALVRRPQCAFVSMLCSARKGCFWASYVAFQIAQLLLEKIGKAQSSSTDCLVG